MMNDPLRNLVGILAGVLLLAWVSIGIARIAINKTHNGGPSDGSG